MNAVRPVQLHLAKPIERVQLRQLIKALDEHSPIPSPVNNERRKKAVPQPLIETVLRNARHCHPHRTNVFEAPILRAVDAQVVVDVWRAVSQCSPSLERGSSHLAWNTSPAVPVPKPLKTPAAGRCHSMQLEQILVSAPRQHLAFCHQRVCEENCSRPPIPLGGQAYL